MSDSVRPLWTPSPERIERANLTRFMRFVRERHGVEAADYDSLWAWSVSDLAAFWESVWHFVGIRAHTPYHAVLEDPRMPGARWFRGATLNFAENLLSRRDDTPALIAADERGGEPVTLTYAELHRQVARLARFLREAGVGPGDRVAAFMPNRPETVIGMLAATSLGAIWSSCSPDFGFRGVMDRFGQIEPKVLIATDGYFYNGRRFDTLERVAHVAREIPAIERVVVVPYLSEAPDLGGIRGAVPWAEALAGDAEEIEFAALPFDHPVYILYSSGTTGAPKCIVHGAGGTLIQHAKELILHTDLRPGERILYFTTCGWMMWNWLVSALFVGATVVLYEGSPSHPDLGVLWRLAERLGLDVLGTSPKFLSAVEKAGLVPGRDFDLSRLRALLSTGSPLAPEQFEWVYGNVKADLQLASISGGTDIVSCFMLGSPISPVYAGEIQKRGLGMRVEAWDETGRPVIGEKGELVCTAPFPSMPVGFWNDPDGERYRDAYFRHFPGVWRHGDYIEITPRGGVIVYGRSDATLNPGGVRIGTAEIYRVVEGLDEVVDSLVIGQPWDNDVRVVLFVVLREGLTLDEALARRIRDEIRRNATPRHVPARILQIPDVPRTISGKKVELAATRVIQGEPVTNRDALANPEALDAIAALREALAR
ncbi:acetoacetate--CoA ligase [Inmirania thermothiophila]|uniref:Acetoacetyl-CoA synthetase n=1 Tax=Inmirania thermothiophila TaxID=1750597 RepID=A0A3N1Y1W4_9GAMM|nr:acetoacetate--CoA ligase [Inmirania thermothiophila]ROR32823.1 acetoacetyl-CoA synthetase [Inmirania thermothiophila]